MMIYGETGINFRSNLNEARIIGHGSVVILFYYNSIIIIAFFFWSFLT